MQTAFNLIKNSNNIVFATHINPDADTIGSALCLMHHLEGFGKQLSVYNCGEPPRLLDFLPGFDKISSFFPEDTELVVSLDCADKERLRLPKGSYKILNIDHHISNTQYGDVNVIDPEAVSTASVVLDFLRVFDGGDISKNSAICLYAALASDTGFFRYDGVDKKVFTDAAYLSEKGADASFISSMMNERESSSKIKLHSDILSTLQLKANGKVAYLYMSLEMLGKSQARCEDAEGVVEVGRSIDGVELSIFLKEQQDGIIRGSLRSRTVIDVNELASVFRGGGHKRAAGFSVEIENSFEDTAQKIISTIEDRVGAWL